ncbi:ketopantoate reductase family protein [uncultured Enterovirga sp.]|uniref:ketopantoate reductase family protein n=1 Tax=uncultured Enterovirga sp. TaxID=2026352 RepID=UPI0035C9E269
MPRTILVVGAGAIGGLFAAMLAGVARVVAFDLSRPHIDAIRAEGLRITGASERMARIEAEYDPSALAGIGAEVAIMLVKSAATGAALASVAPALAEGALLVTLQNGMGNAEALRAGTAPVARGTTMHAARLVGPGHIEHLIAGPTTLGPVRGGIEDVRPLVLLMREAGLEAEAVADPMGAVWSKFVFNAVMNPVGALALGVNAARYEVAEMRALIDQMAEECLAVVAALGGRPAGDPLAYVRRVRSGEAPMSRHAGSMALDMARGVPTEIDELTGFVVREGERLGVPVAACRTVYRLVKGMERARALGAAYGPAATGDGDSKA